MDSCKSNNKLDYKIYVGYLVKATNSQLDMFEVPADMIPKEVLPLSERDMEGKVVGMEETISQLTGKVVSLEEGRQTGSKDGSYASIFETVVVKAMSTIFRERSSRSCNSCFFMYSQLVILVDRGCLFKDYNQYLEQYE
jgi:hypothetical protein